MLFMLFAALAVGCGIPESHNIGNASIIMPQSTKIDTPRTSEDIDLVGIKNTDSARRAYAHYIAGKLTLKYGYDIYGRAAISNIVVKGSFSTAPVLNLYSDWFQKGNAKVVYADIKNHCKKLGFYSVDFFSKTVSCNTCHVAVFKTNE